MSDQEDSGGAPITLNGDGVVVLEPNVAATQTSSGAKATTSQGASSTTSSTTGSPSSSTSPYLLGAGIAALAAIIIVGSYAGLRTRRA